MSRTSIAASYPNRRSFWRGEWGCSYAADFKMKEVAPLIDEIEGAGRLGRVILDAGSGSMHGRGKNAQPKPVPYPLLGKLVVRTDIAMPALYRISGPVLEIQADLENLALGTFSQKLRFLAIARHLGFDPRNGQPQFDAMLFFDILNYVDFRKTLSGLLPFLNYGGRMIISNFPGMGLPEAFSKSGVKNNGELSGYLTEIGMRIEHLYHPPLFHPLIVPFSGQRPQYPSIPEERHEAGSMIVVAVRDAPVRG